MNGASVRSVFGQRRKRSVAGPVVFGRAKLLLSREAGIRTESTARREPCPPKDTRLTTLACILERTMFTALVFEGGFGCIIACAILAVCNCVSTCAVADDVNPEFTNDVVTILKRSCFECHGSDKAEGGLRLDSKANALNGGDAGRAIIPGKPDESELLRRVTLGADDPDVMPARGPRLSDQQVAILREWIVRGADWPDQVDPSAHWAYQKPQRPSVANPQNATWSKNSVDHFILTRLEKDHWQPSPEADRETLIRRVSLDLVGLPPSLSEVDAFLNDDRDDAFECVVDRLLSSPQFGEKWARPWLDLARYADSHGYQRDDLREIWPYRDWVIRSINEDLPFDRFTIEQIAGDLLPNASESQNIATGFNRCVTTNVEAGSDPEETRINQVFDRVNTIGTVWLGTTLECAQCHDHKYDPFTQKDYYQLFAFFNSTEIEADRKNPEVPGSIRFLGPAMPLANTGMDAERSRLKVQLEGVNQDLEHRRSELTRSGTLWETELAQLVANSSQSPPDDVAEILRISIENRSVQQTERLSDYRLELDPAAKDLKTQVTKLDQQLEVLKPQTTLVMRELEVPRSTRIFQRGNFLETGADVFPGSPAALPPLADGPPTRLTLAMWLVSRANPLTARVTVNRWWFEIFGRGLVGTVEDFGLKGDPPSHPELLDWLSVELMDHGWSMKRWLRIVVTSATYRQSSRVTAMQRERDPENKLYSRSPRLRLDAETIRDNALAVAGLLSLKVGGPPVRPYQPDGLWAKIGGDKVDYLVSPGEDRYRRGIYVVWKRSALYPSFVNFDAPARLTCIPKRSRSNTPLQALTLLNDPVYVEAALAFARRIIAECRKSAEISQRLEYAFRLCLGRRPSPSEIATLTRLYDRQCESGRKQPDAVRQFLDSVEIPSEVAAEEFSAWYVVAAAILNLDESITKE